MTLTRVLLLIAGLLIGVGGSPVPLLAQGAGSPETLQAARELASLTSAGVISDFTARLTNQVWPSVETALRNKNPKIDAATLSELRKEFERLQVSTIRESIDDAAFVYARHFTAKELRDMVAFHRTPTGAKMLTVMPTAMAELHRLLQPRLQVLATTVEQRFGAILQIRGFEP
jgi:hypothetical protein